MTVPIHVLHVEDNPEFASMTETWVERHSEAIRISREASPNDALDRLDDQQPDCIVSDYQMPGMTGIELLSAVRESHPDLPFILFTSESVEDVANDALEAGVTDYLQKDTGTEQYGLLANRIEHAVERRRAETDYRQLLEATPTPVVVVDSDAGTVVDANDRLANLAGADRKTIRESPLADFVAEDEAALDSDLTAVADGDSLTVEWAFTTAESRRVTLDAAEIGGRTRVVAFVDPA
ncbi:MAG: response regulator [Halonotius sp.]